MFVQRWVSSNWKVYPIDGNGIGLENRRASDSLESSTLSPSAKFYSLQMPVHAVQYAVSKVYTGAQGERAGWCGSIRPCLSHDQPGEFDPRLRFQILSMPSYRVAGLKRGVRVAPCI